MPVFIRGLPETHGIDNNQRFFVEQGIDALYHFCIEHCAVFFNPRICTLLFLVIYMCSYCKRVKVTNFDTPKFHE